uniref:Sphingomyelin synthase-like domain-containing protein n=1 Tax=Meloidogyne floridensis TaxID=298350 RepID=A0A915NYM5_9BILA
MRSQSNVVNIDQQERPNRDSNSSTSEDSEESLPDSSEEARAPLTRRPQSVQEDEILHDNEEENENARDDQPFTKELTKSKQKIPRERRKTGYAFLLLVFAGFLNDFILSYIHELIPESPPLPDFAFSILPYWPWALIVSEVLMISSFSVMLTVAILHKHRWAVLRLFVTQVPVADPNYYCSPKLKPDERTPLFEVNENKVLSFLDSPRRWLPLHILAFAFSSVGVLSLLFSRGHYSIDVIIAYWITTRIFWFYHTLADFDELRHSFNGRNRFVNVIWYPLFNFMEQSVHRPLPRKYELPFKLPAGLIRYWQQRRGRSNSAGYLIV